MRNYDGAAYGRQNLVDATRVSSNTVYAQLTHRLGVDKVAGMASRLGITSEIGQNLSIALGAQNVSVLDMADAYLTFATRGEQVDPTAIVEVRRSDGSLVDRFGSERVRVLAPEQADVVNHVLREVVEDGTGRRADPGPDVAGKTGTTQDYGDAWFVGYTPKLVAAVWMGFPEGQSRPSRGCTGWRGCRAAPCRRTSSAGSWSTPSSVPNSSVTSWPPPTSAARCSPTWDASGPPARSDRRPPPPRPRRPRRRRPPRCRPPPRPPSTTAPPTTPAPAGTAPPDTTPAPAGATEAAIGPSDGGTGTGPPGG